MTSLHPGDRLDHYRIESLVARSGMASIFRAIDERNGRPVALKIPHPEIESDPACYERFRREQQIGIALNHPGIMKVFADPEQSQVYMAMEWVEGRLLRDILQEQRKLPPERAVRITLGILDALEYIHSQGVVHRDLKPENIMVGKEDQVKLIDFGIAGQEGARRITFAKLSNVMGTPDYISPEQVKGKRGDARSDIYAVGVMLYEMLTGKSPFQGPNAFAIMNDRLLNNPVPPAKSILRSHPNCRRSSTAPSSAIPRTATPRLGRWLGISSIRTKSVWPTGLNCATGATAARRSIAVSCSICCSLQFRSSSLACSSS